MTDALSGDFHYVAIKIVVALMGELLDKDYTLFLDNFYNSFKLSIFLLSRQTDTIRTFMKNRKNLPPNMSKTSLKRGERAVFYENMTNIMVTKWKDKKDVHMISTFVNDRETVVWRSGKHKMVPSVIDLHNGSMGGMDKSDQMMTSYDVERKRVKKWYKKVFNHIVNQCAFNAQILHKYMGGTMTPLKFREALIKSIF